MEGGNKKAYIPRDTRAKAPTGRIKACTTVNRELRRVLNSRAVELAEIIMAKALSGDSAAMLAASNLLLAANRDGL